MTAPHLRDPTGRYRIGPPSTPYQQGLIAKGATSIVRNRQGNFAGVYIDNETPNRDRVAGELRGELRNGELVVVGLYPSEAGHKLPGCIAALEFYPFGGGYEHWPIPKAQALIVQWSFAYPGHKPPTRRQRWHLYLRALARHPKFVWVY